MKKIRKIIISYRNRDTKCSMGTQVFTGSNADVLAANYQSAHPELEESSFKVIRNARGLCSNQQEEEYCMTHGPTRMPFITFVEFTWGMEELSFIQKASLIFKALRMMF